jgi:hypothetical protein
MLPNQASAAAHNFHGGLLGSISSVSELVELAVGKESGGEEKFSGVFTREKFSLPGESSPQRYSLSESESVRFPLY